jgi:hypothetical protein
LDFPGPLEEPMMLIGHGVAQRIYRERRNFVTEIIGGEIAPVRQLMEAIKAAGYEIEFAGISCDATAAVESTVDQTALCSRYPARRQGIENRTWYCRHRGWIALHASAKPRLGTHFPRGIKTPDLKSLD